MTRVLYLPEARADLLDIWQYVYEQSQSVDVADRFIEKLDATCHTLAAQPLSGELRPDLAAEIRCFSARRYVVFYLPLWDGIEVVQIIHGSRDIPARFRRPTGA